LEKQALMEQLPGKLPVLHMPDLLVKRVPAMPLLFSFPAIECLEKKVLAAISGVKTGKSACLSGRRGEGVRVICFYHISSAATAWTIKLLLFHVFPWVHIK
jgi:hypothetical protein